MKNYFLRGIFVVLFMGLFSIPVFGQTRRAAPTPIPTKVEFPQIVAGGDRTISENLNRDLVITGGQLAVTSNVNGDAYIAGGSITISGNISRNLIVAGGKINITGSVGKNLIVAGGEVTIDSKAKIGGYVLGAGNLISLNGQFNGPVKIAGNSLNVGDAAKINGDLEANVSNVQIANTATIAGERKINIWETKTVKPSEKALAGLVTAGALFSFFSKLLVLAILVYLFKGLIRPAAETLRNFWPTLGWGLLMLTVTPIVVIALMVTVVGIPLALILVLLYILALYLSGLVTAAALGEWAAERKWLKTNNIYLLAIAGLMVLTVLGFIPVIGGLVKFIVLLLGLGIIFKQVIFKRA